MDIIHGFSNLEIETANTSSQEVEEEEEKRNWAELPADVMSLIFMKLETIDILGTAQWVCTSWWKVSKQPHLFQSISMQQIWVPFSHYVPYIKRTSDDIYFPVCLETRKQMLMVEMAREAVDRSCGQLVELSVMYFATDELLHYVTQNSESLRCLRLAYCSGITHNGLTQVCQRFPQLEELELVGCLFSPDVFVIVGCSCPHLKSLRLNYTLSTGSRMVNELALVIAMAIPELRHLNLFGNMMTDVGLRAILHGCPYLQSLDLRRCFNLKFGGDLKDMSSNIKLRLPYDSTDDYDEDDFDYDIEEDVIGT